MRYAGGVAATSTIGTGIGTGISDNTDTITCTVTDTGSTHQTSFASRNDEITKMIVLTISCVIAVII